MFFLIFYSFLALSILIFILYVLFHCSISTILFLYTFFFLCPFSLFFILLFTYLNFFPITFPSFLPSQFSFLCKHPLNHTVHLISFDIVSALNSCVLSSRKFFPSFPFCLSVRHPPSNPIPKLHLSTFRLVRQPHNKLIYSDAIHSGRLLARKLDKSNGEFSWKLKGRHAS